MPSKHLKTLNKQASLIEKTFINFAYDPAGNYSPPGLLNAAAYILLMHAELETYIEERVHEIFRLADARWQKNKKPSRTLMAACVYFTGELHLPKKYSSKDAYGALVAKAVKSADSKIGSNHGIREANLMSLLQMIGYDVQRLDPLLVAELDVVGSIRGEHAHKSSRHHIMAKFDPFAIKRKIANALALLATFDIDCNAFRKAQFGS